MPRPEQSCSPHLTSVHVIAIRQPDQILVLEGRRCAAAPAGRDVFGIIDVMNVARLKVADDNLGSRNNEGGESQSSE